MFNLHLGTAGWAIPRVAIDLFPAHGSQLERYASVFSSAEINSSFYRPHRPSTYARWAASVPPSFRFAVKLPREISHTRRLLDTREPLDRFLSEATCLGDRLGPLLLQLPPSLVFDAAAAARFFETLRARFDGAVVCEPRHASWFDALPDELLAAHRVARVAADPAKVPAAGQSGGWPGLVYLRLHGSPVIYRSPYDDAALDTFAASLRNAAAPAWCIFDNTTLGQAALNAAALATRVS